MPLRPSLDWNTTMESVLQNTADIVISQCQHDKKTVNSTVLQALLFYVQGWHMAFFEEMLFESQFKPDNNTIIFPAIAKRFPSAFKPIKYIPPATNTNEDIVLNAVVSSYLSWTDELLMEQVRRDVAAIKQRMCGSAWGESHEFKQHFAILASPEELRKNRFHGLFMDTYRAKKYRLKHWVPPNEPSAEEISEFEKMAII